MKKYPTDLTVDWALLGERGWWIDESGAEAADLDPTETMGCHLDRATLDILMCGPADWCAARLRDLADAGVPRLEGYKSWVIVPPQTGTADTSSMIARLYAERQGDEGMVVMNKYGDLYVNVTPQHFENGDKVRVVREEAK